MFIRHRTIHTGNLSNVAKYGLPRRCCPEFNYKCIYEHCPVNGSFYERAVAERNLSVNRPHVIEPLYRQTDRERPIYEEKGFLSWNARRHWAIVSRTLSLRKELRSVSAVERNLDQPDFHRLCQTLWMTQFAETPTVSYVPSNASATVATCFQRITVTILIFLFFSSNKVGSLEPSPKLRYLKIPSCTLHRIMKLIRTLRDSVS